MGRFVPTLGELDLSKLFWSTVLLATGAMAQAIQLYIQPPHTPGDPGGDGLSAFTGLDPVVDRELADDFVVDGPGWYVDAIQAHWTPDNTFDLTPITKVHLNFYHSLGGTVGPEFEIPNVLGTSILMGSNMYLGRQERIITVQFDPILFTPGEYFVHMQTEVQHNWFWLTSTPTSPVQNSPAHFRNGPDAAGGVDPSWPTTWTAMGSNEDNVFNSQYDLAFSLHGQPVPEPATMSVLALGLGYLAYRKRKRSKV